MTRTAVYRHYDDTGALLYVGMTCAPEKRIGAHRRDAAWFPDVHNSTTEWYHTREEAAAAERRAVMAEKPTYNLQLQEVSPAHALIEALGGYRDLASRLCENETTVHMWRVRGIPAAWYIAFLQMASEAGLPEPHPALFGMKGVEPLRSERPLHNTQHAVTA